GDAGDVEQARRERRLGGGVLVAQVERPGGEHRASGQELQRRRVGCRLGLDEHGWLLETCAESKVSAVCWLSLAQQVAYLGGVSTRLLNPPPAPPAAPAPRRSRRY